MTENFSAVIHKGKILRHFEIFQINNDIYNEFFTQHNLRTDKTSSQVLFSLSRKSLVEYLRLILIAKEQSK